MWLSLIWRKGSIFSFSTLRETLFYPTVGINFRLETFCVTLNKNTHGSSALVNHHVARMRCAVNVLANMRSTLAHHSTSSAPICLVTRGEPCGPCARVAPPGGGTPTSALSKPMRSRWSGRGMSTNSALPHVVHLEAARSQDLCRTVDRLTGTR